MERPRDVYFTGKLARRALKHEAKKSKKIERKVRNLQRLTKPEFKDVTITNTGAAVTLGQNTNAMVQTLLSNIAVGNAGNQRSGDKIKIMGLSFRMPVGYGFAGANFIRVMIIQIKGIYRTLTGGSESQLLSEYDVTLNAFNNMISYTNPDYTVTRGMPDTRKNDVKVLFDKKVQFSGYFGLNTGAGGTSISFGEHRYIQYNKRFKNPLTVTYNGNAQANGQLAVIVLPGANTNAVLNPNYGWSGRLYFIDS